MIISSKTWSDYIKRLEKLNVTAGELMRKYIETHGTGDLAALVEYAFGLVTRYGEASGALAAEMYDAIAEASGVVVPAAEPAAVSGLASVKHELDKANGSPPLLEGAVSRMVKQTAADTTLKNATRDGAEWAWVPHGDTCAFCMTLASRGWQKASKKSLNGGHATHIHAHCNCEYAVRFGGKGGVAGYDPDEYERRYKSAGGSVESLRRQLDGQNRDKINAQKRAAYAERKKRAQTHSE